MILFKKCDQLKEHLKQLKVKGQIVGFVPTMGALHQGHLSLLNASVSAGYTTVCSIFINPTQFNDSADFHKYPITLTDDIGLLNESETSILFLPDVNEIYPNGFEHPRYDLAELDKTLEGKYRPGHFQGVCQVMHRLLEIVQPHHLYMGQKDYQQCMVVDRLIKILHLETVLHVCPTLREPDGLAMSSRNIRLTPEERKKATAIFTALTYLKENIQQCDLSDFIKTAASILAQNQLKADYVEIADAHTLHHITYRNGNQKLIALIAAYINEVRLIDNMALN